MVALEDRCARILQAFSFAVIAARSGRHQHHQRRKAQAPNDVPAVAWLTRQRTTLHGYQLSTRTRQPRQHRGTIGETQGQPKGNGLVRKRARRPRDCARLRKVRACAPTCMDGSAGGSRNGVPTWKDCAIYLLRSDDSDLGANPAVRANFEIGRSKPKVGSNLDQLS